MDRHNKNDMHMKDTQNTEAQEEACAEAEAGDAGSAVQALPENLESLCREHVCPNCTENAMPRTRACARPRRWIISRSA